MDIRHSPQLVLRLAFRFANNGISSNPKLERRQIVSRPAFSEIRDFLADALRRIAVHQIGVAFLGDQLFGRRRFAAPVKRWPRLGHRFGLQNVVFHPVVLPGI